MPGPGEGGWVSAEPEDNLITLVDKASFFGFFHARKGQLCVWSPAAYMQSRSHWVIHGVQEKYLWSCIS